MPKKTATGLPNIPLFSYYVNYSLHKLHPLAILSIAVSVILNTGATAKLSAVKGIR